MASTSQAAEYTGIGCPLAISFGFTHGTSPVSGTVEVFGQDTIPPLGSFQTFQVGDSTFSGYIVGNEYDPVTDRSIIHMVDWRDRLHDFHMACAFNCEEDDGTFYHMLPYNWQVQRRTYVTRELGQFDFDSFQRLDPNTSFNIQLAKNRLYSALTILDWMGSVFGFYVFGDTLALFALATNYPLNLDWNSGQTKAIDAMQQIMTKCNCQMAFYGYNQCYITIRGFTESIWTQALEFGSLENFCILGVSTGKTGEELNELGRRIVVIGDRNKYEFVYPCRINWNPAWTASMAANELEMQALLDANGLTMFNKVRDLPEKYHDDETWLDNDNAGKGALPARKTRNDMLIKDYLDKIVYRAYLVDSTYYLQDFEVATTEKFVGTVGFLDNDLLAPIDPEHLYFELKDFQKELFWDQPTSNFRYPLSQTLVTDSNLQCIIYSTSDDIIKSAIPTDIISQTCLVPKTRGTNLDVETVINPVTGEVEYRVRIFFSEMQFFNMKDGGGDTDRELSITDVPDTILVRLSLDTNIYTYQAGEARTSKNVRIREQQVSVRNLYQAFVNAQEVTVLRENVKAYWERRLGAQPLEYQTIRADTIAQAIAFQALAHYAVTRSGSVHYDDICGTTPDGLIDSVQVGFVNAPGSGITEDVNFTANFADTRDFRHPFPVQISRKFKDEEQLQLDFAKQAAQQAMKERQNKNKVLQLDIDGEKVKIGNLGRMVAYAQDGIMEVDFTAGFLNDEEKVLELGNVIVLGLPSGDETPPEPDATDTVATV